MVLWWDLSIKLLFLSSPCSYYIKHSTHTWTARKASNVRGEQKNKINKTKTTKKSDKPKQNKTKIYKRANEDYVTTKYYYILRFSTSYNETNSRHFQQLKNSCHTSIEKKTKQDKKKLIYVHFKCWLRLLPLSQCSPSNPGGHKHRYPLNVNPDWQVALFSQLRPLSQAF